MAEANILLGKEEFCCSVCLDLLKDPVTISCGHSFCMNCINSFWDQQSVSSCPECRTTFDPRPSVCRNHMMAVLVEKLREAGHQFMDGIYATPEDVECDICTGRKRKAIKSCLVCLASYCEAHFQPHRESAALKKHMVTEASTHIHEKICSQHGKLLEVYCRTDQKCICYVCTLDGHCGHKIVSTVAEKAEKEKQVFEAQNIYKQRIQKREGERQELMESIKSLKRSAHVAEKDTHMMLDKLIQSIKERFSEAVTQIRAQEVAELSRAEKHLMKVEQEIADLRKTEDQLQHLTQIEDDIYYLQIFSLHDPSQDEDIFPRIEINKIHSDQNIKIFVNKLIKITNNFKLHPDHLNKSQLKASRWTSSASHPKKNTQSICTYTPKFSSVTTTEPQTRPALPIPTFLFGSSTKPATVPVSTDNCGTETKSVTVNTSTDKFGTETKPTTVSMKAFPFGTETKPTTVSMPTFPFVTETKPTTVSMPTFPFVTETKTATVPMPTSIVGTETTPAIVPIVPRLSFKTETKLVTVNTSTDKFVTQTNPTTVSMPTFPFVTETKTVMDSPPDNSSGSDSEYITAIDLNDFVLSSKPYQPRKGAVRK